jgi:hypothetical protein
VQEIRKELEARALVEAEMVIVCSKTQAQTARE